MSNNLKIYAINLTVDTKTTDIYDQVAINKFPLIVICKDEQELWDKLSSEETALWIKQNVRTQRLFDSAYFYIRELEKGYGETLHRELCWKADSLVKVTYN